MAIMIVSGCVLDPSYAFEKWYGRGVVGQRLSVRTAEWDAPLSVEETDRGTRIYAYAFHCCYPRRGECTIYYEVKEDTIVATWHKGPDCWYHS